MGHGERRVDTKELEGVRDLDLGSEAGKEAVSYTHLTLPTIYSV